VLAYAIWISSRSRQLQDNFIMNMCCHSRVTYDLPGIIMMSKISIVEQAVKQVRDTFP
jgi:hypothetical protein